MHLTSYLHKHEQRRSILWRNDVKGQKFNLCDRKSNKVYLENDILPHFYRVNPVYQRSKPTLLLFSFQLYPYQFPVYLLYNYYQCKSVTSGTVYKFPGKKSVTTFHIRWHFDYVINSKGGRINRKNFLGGAPRGMIRISCSESKIPAAWVSGMPFWHMEPRGASNPIMALFEIENSYGCWWRKRHTLGNTPSCTVFALVFRGLMMVVVFDGISCF